MNKQDFKGSLIGVNIKGNVLKDYENSACIKMDENGNVSAIGMDGVIFLPEKAEPEPDKVEKNPLREWEILSFTGVMEYDSELFALGHDGMYRLMGRYGVTLESMMKSVIDGFHAIKSVRILSDNRILTLGDNTDFGVIAAFSFNEIDDLVVNTTKGNIICARMVYKVGECKNSFYGKPVPPIGLIPEFIHKTARLNEIQGAIDRYNSAFKEVPQDWVNEKRYIDDWLTNYHLRKIKKQ